MSRRFVVKHKVTFFMTPFALSTPCPTSFQAWDTWRAHMHTFVRCATS